MPDSEINLDIPKIAEYVFKIFRYLSFACAVYCLFGLNNSIKENYPLWISPLYAEGTIVNYEETSWQSHTNGTYVTTTAKLPVVQFQDTANATIKFTDNVGHKLAEYKRVPVIYSKNNPKNAKIDKGLFNWLDTYIWLFGAICGLLGIVRLSEANTARMLKKLSDKNV